MQRYFVGVTVFGIAVILAAAAAFAQDGPTIPGLDSPSVAAPGILNPLVQPASPAGRDMRLDQRDFRDNRQAANGCFYRTPIDG